MMERKLDNESQSNISIEAAAGEYTVPLKQLFRVIWQRLWVVILAAIVVVGVGVGFSLLQTPIYESHAEILVGQEQKGEGGPGTLQSDILGLQTLAMTAVEAVDSRRVAEDVVRKLDLQTTPEALLGGLTVERVVETQFIRITYMDEDPEQAQKIADAIAAASSEQISAVSPSTNISATVWESATEPGAPISPNVARNAVLALLLGLMFGVGLALLLEYLDDSWQSPEELEMISGLPAFGIVPRFDVSKAKKKVQKTMRRQGDENAKS